MKRFFIFPLTCLLALMVSLSSATPAMAQTDADGIRKVVSTFYDNYRKAGYIDSLVTYLQKQPEVDPAFIAITKKRHELEAKSADDDDARKINYDPILQTQSDFQGLEYGRPFIDGNIAEILVYKLWKEGKGAHAVLLGKKDGIWRITDIVSTPLVMGDFDSMRGVVDEAQFRESLKAWIRLCNRFILKFRDVPREEADILFQKNPSFRNLQDSDELARLDKIVRPVLNRWEEYGGPEKLGSDDRAVGELLEEYGIRFATAEGYPMLLVNQAFFINMLTPYLSQATVSYLAIRANQPDHYFDASACYYSHAEMGDWAVIWERYLNNPAVLKATDSGYVKDAAKRYKAIMDYLLFSELESTPAFPKPNRQMQDAWADGLRGIADTYSKTKTANILREFLRTIEPDARMLTPETKATFTAKIAAVCSGKAVSAKTETQASKANLADAEKKLLGKHRFSLQWISHEKFGTATVTRKDGGLFIDAQQKLDGNYVTLQGDIKIVDAREFTVTGDLVTRVSYVNQGNECARNGTFTFKATGNRKYWRMQEMKNPCDKEGPLDYVDVFF
ncbi:hypothetical protein LJB81_00105 [Desulfovibrio sp. OttesenSCG-928-M14]|nr:hypothetical protein [Desulfovibrio sp. OttesenSCG-928-M14]